MHAILLEQKINQHYTICNGNCTIWNLKLVLVNYTMCCVLCFCIVYCLNYKIIITTKLLSTEAYFCHPHVKILTCHVNIIRNQKATCWNVSKILTCHVNIIRNHKAACLDVGIFSHYIIMETWWHIEILSW